MGTKERALLHSSPGKESCLRTFFLKKGIIVSYSASG
jgi:hypothetical protein